VDDTKYLFIDGGYAQQIYRRAMREVFAEDGDLSVQKIVQMVKPFRTYYYDCVDETKRDSESESDFLNRVAFQELYAIEIRSIPGVHLRRGTLIGEKQKRRQKEIDVMLTVDMLPWIQQKHDTRSASSW
jgi:NYN domain